MTTPCRNKILETSKQGMDTILKFHSLISDFPFFSFFYQRFEIIWQHNNVRVDKWNADWQGCVKYFVLVRGDKCAVIKIMKFVIRESLTPIKFFHVVFKNTYIKATIDSLVLKNFTLCKMKCIVVSATILSLNIWAKQQYFFSFRQVHFQIWHLRIITMLLIFNQ